MNSGDPIIEKLVDDDEPHLSSELFRSIFLPVATLPLLTQFSEMPWTADCEYHVDMVLRVCLLIGIASKC
jgi:hypothetical protein